MSQQKMEPLQLHKVKQFFGNSFGAVVLGIVAAIATLLLQISHLSATQLDLPPSQYSSTIQAPFNQPSFYPITPNPPSPLYKPVGEWVGRLILPTAEQYQQVAKKDQEPDWAWFEVEVAPAKYKNLIGQTIRLAWSQEPIVQTYVRTASRDVRFTPAAEQAFKSGVINPIRLNGRDQVGPLQSLAGGHPYDDVTVVLKGDIEVEPTKEGGKVKQGSPPLKPPPSTLPTPSSPPSPTSPSTSSPSPSPSPTLPTLRINREPFQETGRYYALVKFLEPVPPKDPQNLPQACPGDRPCASDRMKVRHYNPQTKQFDGKEEVIYIPQQPKDNQGIFNMTTRDLAKSPAGEAGWYIYGASDKTEMFTVQAMKPRSLVQIQPQQTVQGFRQGLKYVSFDNWKAEAIRKGTLQTVESNGKTDGTTWKVGDRALVMHLYGGRGGTQPHSERFIAGTYAGHFSFGLAQVIKDVFTGEPIFDIDYLQVYGNGGDGTLSGGNTWANYMGNLRRGILGTRPVSDVLIKLDALTDDYDFGGTKFSFFRDLLGQLSLVGARYRIGDGTGNSTITSATSCVQDSAQAVFMTLNRLRQKIEDNPQIVQWMKDHPDDPNTQRFKQLVNLSKDLAKQLVPMGVVRWDWEQNAEILTGVRSDNDFISIDNFQIKNLLTGLISWRTAMPRQAHDEFAMVFLRNRGNLHFLRPNQVGGYDPGIAPLEPTLLFGAWKLPFTEIPIVAYLVIRAFGGVSIPTWLDWLKTLGVFLVFAGAAIATCVGFLSWNPWKAPWHQKVLTSLRLLFIPALVEEFVFRVLLLPYPNLWIPEVAWWGWALLALGIYVGFHWLRARYGKHPIAAKPEFLILVALLGLACTFTYRLTGSLWTITIFHWIAVLIWWLGMGGKQQSLREKARRGTLLQA